MRNGRRGTVDGERGIREEYVSTRTPRVKPVHRQPPSTVYRSPFVLVKESIN